MLLHIFRHPISASCGCSASRLPRKQRVLFVSAPALAFGSRLDGRLHFSISSLMQEATGTHNQSEKSLCGPPLIRSPFENPNRRHPLQPGSSVTAKAAEMAFPAQQEVAAQPPLAQPSQSQVQTPSLLKMSTKDESTASEKMDQQKPADSTPISEDAGSSGSSGDSSFQERQWKGVKIGFIFLGIAFAVGIGYLLIFIVGPPIDPLTGEVLKDQYSDMNRILAHLLRFLDLLAFSKRFIQEPSREKLLPDPVKPPWHQPKYTVVMELRNVLVSPTWDYKRGHFFVKRPALDYFMGVVGYPNFELVIYTSETINNAYIVQQIDPDGHRVNHALFRDCTKYKDGAHMKDLSRLNRDLSKVIYIDWEPAAFRLNPENVLRVPKWNKDMDDTYLVDLAELLKTIHLSDVEDVRPILQFYSQFDNPMAEFRRRAKMLNQQQIAQELQKSDSSSSAEQAAAEDPVKKYRGNLFGARRHAI